MRVKRQYGVHKYADGGKVELNKKVKKGDKKAAPEKPKEEAPKEDTSKLSEYAGMSVRERQMKELGLKDGGKVKMKPPEKGGKPKRITTPGKPGDTGPWGANPARNRKPKKMACGGKVKK